MQHALRYIGGYERNFPALTTASSTFEGTDGKVHPYPEWPASVNGLRISYMEKHGKKFVAVRVADGTDDVVLVNELALIPGEHFGFGTKLSGEPSIVDDNVAILKLLEDIIKKNHDHAEKLLMIRTRFKAAAHQK
jgi:hypothetical protein